MPLSRPFAAIALTPVLLLASCGKGPETPSPAAAKAPLEGRSVSKPSQLVAAWMAVQEGPLDGIEFLKDGKAMMTAARSGTVTIPYTLLDDGRVSLVDAMGRTSLYRTTLAGDTLELTPEQPGEAAQRFQRVPEGQTLAQAITAHQARMMADMEQRINKLRDLLARGEIVIAATEGEDRWVMAMTFDQPSHSLDGSMVLDSPIAGRNDALNPIRVLPVRADTRPVSLRSNQVQIVLNAGPATEPANQQEVSGEVVLTIDGPLDKPTISGEANFPKLWPGPRPVALSRHQDLHAAAFKKLADQRATIAAEIARMESFLGGRAEFSGQRIALGGTAPEAVRLLVERIEQGPGYAAVVLAPDRPEQAAQAQIDLVIGEAALYVTTPWGEQWRLQTTDAPNTMDGLWRPHNRTDFISHGNLVLNLDRRWTNEQVAAERAAIQRFLTEDLRTPQRFIGFTERRFGNANTVRWPVSVEIQAQSDSAVTGTGWMISHRDGVALTGTRSGRSFTLQGNTPLPGSNDPRQTDAQRWQLHLSGIDPRPTLVGEGSRNRHGGGSSTLTLATPEHTAALRAQLVSALTAARYTARTADTSSLRDEQMYFVFDTVDAAGGKVTGRIIGDGSKWNNGGAPPAILEGDIVEEHGMPILRLTVRGAPDPARGGGKDYEPFTLELAAFEMEGTLHLTGSTPPGKGNQDWLTLDPVPTDFIIPMDPMRETRLAALRLGAVAERITYLDRKPGEVGLVFIEVTERDAKVGQIFHADGRYHHGNSVAAAAIHAGLAVPGEVGVFRLTFVEPFTAPVEASERNGVASQRANFKPGNTVPTFRIERVVLP
jgi:hypothetical protein